MRHLEVIVEATASELSSAIWYLKQRGLAASDDKSSMQITVDGMDFLKSNRPMPKDVMLFIKGNGDFRSPQEPGAGNRVGAGDAESGVGAEFAASAGRSGQMTMLLPW